MRNAHEYLNHARAVAKQWGIRMIEDSGLAQDEAHAEPTRRTVVHAPITNDRSYIVSLHEMGHIVNPNGFIRDQFKAKTELEKVKLQLVEEEAAWDWAIANVLDGEWTEGMEAMKTFAMGTYISTRDMLMNGGLPDGGVFTLGGLFDGLFDGMFDTGGPMPMQPPKPPVPHDPTAAQRRASTYRAVATSIVDRIKKGAS